MEEQILLLSLAILLCQLYNQSCYADTEQNVTIAEYSTAALPCLVSTVASTTWIHTTSGDATPDTFSQGTFVYPKFENKFSLEISDDSSNNTRLTLKFNGTEEDEGRYSCQESGIDKALFNLVVEVPPVLHLEINNTLVKTSSIDVVSSQTVIVTCVAEEGKPQVKLSWRVNDEEKSGPIIADGPPSSDRTVTSIIHYVPAVGDNTLTCVTSGQQVIPEKEVSLGVNVQYSPNCVMSVTNTSNAFVISCSCKANPKVKRYEIYVNGSLFSKEMKATLPSKKPATVFCKATNGVGNDTTEPQNLKAFHEDIPIQISESSLVFGLVLGAVILIALITIAVIAICMYRNKKKDAEEREKWAKRNLAAANMSLKPLPEYTEENEPLKEDADKGVTEGKTNNDHETSKAKQDQSDGVGTESTPHEKTKQEQDNLLEDNHEAEDTK